MALLCGTPAPCCTPKLGGFTWVFRQRPSFSISLFTAAFSKGSSRSGRSLRVTRAGKSNADLCKELKEFLLSVGLPPNRVPSMKELSQHGRASTQAAGVIDSSSRRDRLKLLASSIKGHRKRHVIEEDELINKTGKYITWEEDDGMVMSWIMNSVQPQIASTITYYTTAKEMWDFLRQTYSQDKNVSKILQVEEELHNLRQGNQDLSQYFATVKATYERLKFLRPPCKSCYKSHFEPTMVAKFLAGLSHEYAATKDQMLTGSEIPELSDAYNRLSRFAISLSQPTGVTPASALAVGSGRGHGSTYSARGRGMGRGTGGRGRFQCTYCGKIGHLEDRCWDKHGRPSSLSQGRNMVTKQSKSPAYSSMGSAQTATPTLEESSPSIAPGTVSIDKVEQDLANIVRRRGYKLIGELLRGSANTDSKTGTSTTAEINFINQLDQKNSGQDDRSSPSEGDHFSHLHGSNDVFHSIDDIHKQEESPHPISLHEKAARFVMTGELESTEGYSCPLVLSVVTGASLVVSLLVPPVGLFAIMAASSSIDVMADGRMGEWIIDSGATHHMTGDPKVFHGYKLSVKDTKERGFLKY
ncbi:hypothetical protein EJ110_NYTH50438 [Nymphaea thermarum]|nr:hypothetical protein EJ110_NYTH50438 [Nymphaea thermarum]